MGASAFLNHPNGHVAWFGPGLPQSRRRPESAIIGYQNAEAAGLLAAARGRERLWIEP